jgi:hypothetical protein
MPRIVEFRDDNVGAVVEVEVTPGPVDGVVAIRVRQTTTELGTGQWGPSTSIDLRDGD